MTPLCQCASDEEAIEKGCTRSGQLMVGRLRQLCAGINCTKEKSEQYRAMWDGRKNDPGYTPPPIPQRTAPCVYRGEATRSQECPTCSGNVRVKIFACPLHKECTIAKQLEGVACCGSCPDYEAVKNVV